RQQIHEARIVGEIGSKHQCINKEADEPLNLFLCPIGNWGAYRNIPLPTRASQQDLESSQQCHKQRRSFAPGKVLQLLNEPTGQEQTLLRASEGLQGGSRMIEWQLQRKKAS